MLRNLKNYIVARGLDQSGDVRRRFNEMVISQPHTSDVSQYVLYGGSSSRKRNLKVYEGGVGKRRNSVRLTFNLDEHQKLYANKEYGEPPSVKPKEIRESDADIFKWIRRFNEGKITEEEFSRSVDVVVKFIDSELMYLLTLRRAIDFKEEVSLLTTHLGDPDYLRNLYPDYGEYPDEDTDDILDFIKYELEDYLKGTKSKIETKVDKDPRSKLLIFNFETKKFDKKTDIVTNVVADFPLMVQNKEFKYTRCTEFVKNIEKLQSGIQCEGFKHIMKVVAIDDVDEPWEGYKQIQLVVQKINGHECCRSADPIKTFTQILAAVRCIWENKLAHMDIEDDNIIVDTSGNAFIIDLDLLTKLNSKTLQKDNRDLRRIKRLFTMSESGSKHLKELEKIWTEHMRLYNKTIQLLTE